MIHNNHELYTFNNNSNNLNQSIDRQMQSTRTNRNMNNRSSNNYLQKPENKYDEFRRESNSYLDRNIFQKNNSNLPVQKFSYTNQGYRMNNFCSFNNIKDKKLEKYYDMNPINTRRDIFEQLRNDDDEQFKEKQGGPLIIMENNLPTSTRNNKNYLKNSYIGNGRNLAIPSNKI